MVVDKRVPVIFEKVETLDSRFTKVKIWLMHTGLNYNRSIFDKEVVDNALSSVKNTPILAYIEESRTGEIDFAGHEMEVVVKDGELKFKYLGKAVGVIPEDCNPRWEQKAGDTGELLDYLVVDGIMWNKFDDAVDILNSNEEVSQSMELSDEYDGFWNEEGNFVFRSFQFYGACLLGQNVLPAMQKASVELYSYSDGVVYTTIQEKMNEYKSLLTNSKMEVEQKMTLEELLAKYSTTVEALAEKGVDVSTFSIEDLEVKLAEVFTTNDEGAEQVEGEGEQPSTAMEAHQNGEGAEGSADEGEAVQQPDANEGEGQASPEGADGTFSLSFELSHEDIRRNMYDQLSPHMEQAGVGSDWYYIVSIYESHIIAENGDGDKFYMVGYTKDGDNISFSDVSEVHPMFLTAEEKGALELMRNSFEQIKTENAQLKDFQATVIQGQHEAQAEELFTQFNKLSAEEVADLRENVHQFTLEEIESRLFERLGRKTANFSTKQPTTPKVVKIVTTGEAPNSVDHLFKKHGFAK